ncbi:MAG: RluA family pseudouridine synthase [Patescibacteria group bacterium]|nr:RluA family pseudouridine synthase [Patescibacteria group bacterium]
MDESVAPLIERLDQYVVRQMPSVSRAFASKLIEEGHVTVSGDPQRKSGYKLRTADVVEIHFDELHTIVIPEVELPIVYEDDDCVVIIKPIGMLTHSKGAFNPEATVATWLRPRLDIDTFEPAKLLPQSDAHETALNPNIYVPSNDRLGIVHRLDRATSGVMICAKNPVALSWLQKQFSQRKVKKSYIAVVTGRMQNGEAIIDMPVERNPKKPQTFRVGSNGKSAVTQYQVLDTSDALSLLELKPSTGRTHQLRVHLHEIGHPIVGDTLYNGTKAPRLYLHAKSLELTLPSRKRVTFEAPLPTAFKELLSK